MIVSARSWFFLFGVLVVLWPGLTASAHADQPMRLPVDAALISVLDAEGATKARFSVEIARTVDERSRGLMHRTDLPADRSMLFVFETERPLSFWMHNTPLPLDIIYADGTGVIVSVAAETTPFSRAPIPSGAPARYALEVHAGTAERLSIGAGDRLQHPAIDGR